MKKEKKTREKKNAEGENTSRVCQPDQVPLQGSFVDLISSPSWKIR